MLYMILKDGFEETEALATLDVMRRAGLEVKTVGVTGDYVTGSHNVTVKSDIINITSTKINALVNIVFLSILVR